MALHVYGVVRADHPAPEVSRGVGPAPGPVRLVRSGSLAAAVSPIEDGTELTEEDAVRHLDVLVDLLRAGPVLPIRFGTVSPDAEALASEILQPAADDLAGSLDSLDGLVELRVVVSADESTEIADVVRELPRADIWTARARSAPLDERIQLGEYVHARLRERRDRRSAVIRQRLAPRSRGVRELSSEDPTTSKIAVLVPSDQLKAFDRDVRDLFSHFGPGYEGEYIGPLPAVDFADLDPPSEQPSRRWGWIGSPDTTRGWGW